MDAVIRSAVRFLCVFALLATARAAPVGTELRVIPLTIGRHTLTAEVAATPEHRATGLMHRFSLKPDHGMVFVFERAELQAFWMKNTFIPLSIAFITSDGRIISIEDMTPKDERSYWSSGPAQYALGMRKGWFAERGIKSGDRVEGLPQPKR
jgi:hypothetical protein